MRLTGDPARRADRTTVVRERVETPWLQVGLLLLACALGFVVAWQGWHRPLVDAFSHWLDDPAFAAQALFRRADLLTLSVDLDFEDYQTLLDRRERVLRLGVNVGDAADAVPAVVHAADAATQVLLRFPQGPADALAGQAWPLEAAVQDDGALFGLRHVSLTPADDALLSTWGYLTSLRQAGLLAPRCEVVHLTVNGADWGPYAMEERPTADLLRAQGRDGSVVVTFDQRAYWEALALGAGAPPGGGFQYAQVACASDDPLLDNTCAAAARLLRQVQDGDVAPSAAFDVERLADYLALTALWRGTPAPDWRALSFAYDPATARLEPVASGAAFASAAPLPSYLTADPALQAAVVRALAAAGRPEALADVRAALEADVERLRLMLGAGALPWSDLEARQAAIRRQLAPLHPLLATVAAENGALVLHLRNPQPFLVEAVGLDVGESAFLRVDPAWVDAADGAALADVPGALVLRAADGARAPSVCLRVPTTALRVGADQAADEVRVTVRLYGLDAQHVVVATWEAP
ncbi:MAG: CotH kinase family protein [Anaerolineae bacterium]|nr:CotH kinase family protein [Anaerolineae bacterium]